MARQPLRNPPWSDSDLEQLRQLAAEKMPTRDIAKKLKRTVKAVQAKASRKGIALVGTWPGRRIENQTNAQP